MLYHDVDIIQLDLDIIIIQLYLDVDIAP